MHHYLISYMDLPRSQMGAVDIKVPYLIRDMSDVENVTRDIRQHNQSSTLQVTGFSKFEEN